MNKTGNVFEEMDIYWAEIAAENSTSEQLNLIKNIIKKGKLVLDLACGTGRHTNALSREGYLVIGIDVSAGLLRIAQKSGHSQLVRGDMRFLPFRSNAFSYVLSMDTSFGYLPSEREDVLSLSEVSRILKRDGSFVLDVFNSEYLIQKYHRLTHRISNYLKNLQFWFFAHSPNGFVSRLFSHSLTWKQYPSFFLLSKRSVNMNGGRLSDLWVVRDKFDGKIRVYWHTVRLYNPQHLQAVLKQANFEVGKVFGGYQQETFDLNSKRIIFIADPTQPCI